MGKSTINLFFFDVNDGLLIRGTPQMVIIWYLNGTPQITQSRGLLLQVLY